MPDFSFELHFLLLCIRTHHENCDSLVILGRIFVQRFLFKITSNHHENKIFSGKASDLRKPNSEKPYLSAYDGITRQYSADTTVE